MMDSAYSSIARRLKMLRYLGGIKITQAEFAAQIGIPQRSWSRYETGETIPDALLLGKICDVTGANADWLLRGQGPIMTIERFAPELLGYKERYIYRNISLQVGGKTLPKDVALPVMGLASCGKAGWYNRQNTASREKYPPKYSFSSDVFALMTVGTSMEPDGIREGSIIFCDPRIDLAEKDSVCIEQADGLLAIKRYLGRDDQWTYVQGWREPKASGDQEPYTEQLLNNVIKRLTCVAVIKCMV